MLPIPQDILKRLRLEDAVAAEAASTNNLLPDQPGWSTLNNQAERFAQWLRGQLRSGLPVAPQQVVLTRKPQHGVRPVPILGPTERVAYRALVDFILRNEPPLDRSPEAYLTFIGAPVVHAREVDKPDAASIFAWTVGSATFNYVVKTDITAFYQYVDHAILCSELLSKTGDFEAINCLGSLLAETQSRSFGIPQLLESSDRLSEVYIDMLERALLRRGWPTWRFNDDFRIAARNYPEALNAIEDREGAAQQFGLTISETKTTTPRFSTYAFETLGLTVDDDLPEQLRRHDPEDFVGDYTEGVGEEDPTWAIDLLAAAWSPDMPAEGNRETGIPLSNLKVNEIRRLRRAVGRVTRAADPASLPHVLKLVVYAPSLTPWLIRYVTAVGDQAPEMAEDVMESILAKVSLSDWQRLWILRGLNDLGLLRSAAPGNSDSKIEWVRSLLHARHTPAVEAEALYLLASVDGIDLATLEHSLRTLPSALAPWSLAAIRSLKDRGVADESVVTAIRAEGGISTLMLGD